MRRYCVLVVAKAPVPGLAKTRLTPPATREQAARIAAASLLDTLDAVAATPGAVPLVALTGDLAMAAESVRLRARLNSFEVFDQRGEGFAARLANAHAEVAARYPGLPVVQVGMDTPQVTPLLLTQTWAGLAVADVVVGPAEDGGWWVLGLRDPADAAVLRDVAMSTSDTFTDTVAAFGRRRVVRAATLSDVDTMADARAVAAEIPRSRFASAVDAVPAVAMAGGRGC